MTDALPRFFESFDVNKMMAGFNFQPLNVEAVWTSQRRNLEALTQANQLAVEGVQALARRQMEITRQSFEDFSSMMRELVQPVSPQDRVAKNAEYAKQMLEKGVNNGRELVQLAAKAGGEAADVLQKRATEGLDEITTFATQTTR